MIRSMPPVAAPGVHEPACRNGVTRHPLCVPRISPAAIVCTHGDADACPCDRWQQRHFQHDQGRSFESTPGARSFICPQSRLPWKVKALTDAPSIRTGSSVELFGSEYLRKTFSTPIIGLQLGNQALRPSMQRSYCRHSTAFLMGRTLSMMDPSHLNSPVFRQAFEDTLTSTRSLRLSCRANPCGA